jgi:PTS system fructose IIA component
LSDYGVLIVAHGSLAEGFLEAASMIVGKTENTKAVCFDSTQGVEGLEKVVLALTRFRGPIRVKGSGLVKGVEDGQDRQKLLA